MRRDSVSLMRCFDWLQSQEEARVCSRCRHPPTAGPVRSGGRAQDSKKIRPPTFFSELLKIDRVPWKCVATVLALCDDLIGSKARRKPVSVPDAATRQRQVLCDLEQTRAS